MANYYSAYSGAQIDLAVGSGSTVTGIIKDFATLSGSSVSTGSMGRLEATTIQGTLADSSRTDINSVLATDLVLGEDAQTKIDFETANEIHFDVNNSELLNMTGVKISGSSVSTASFARITAADNIHGTTLVGTKVSALQTVSALQGNFTSLGGIGLTVDGTVSLTGGENVVGIKSEVISVDSNLQLEVSSSGATFVLSGAARTVTLPHVASSSGAVFTIISGDDSEHIITASNPSVSNKKLYGQAIDLSNATTIVGAQITAAHKLTLTNSKIGDRIKVMGDGTNWYVDAMLNDTPTIVTG